MKAKQMQCMHTKQNAVVVVALKKCKCECQDQVPGICGYHGFELSPGESILRVLALLVGGPARGLCIRKQMHAKPLKKSLLSKM